VDTSGFVRVCFAAEAPRLRAACTRIRRFVDSLNTMEVANG
jgi:hypothetical protein